MVANPPVVKVHGNVPKPQNEPRRWDVARAFESLAVTAELS